jgi:hypothetical protein
MTLKTTATKLVCKECGGFYHTHRTKEHFKTTTHIRLAEKNKWNKIFKDY